MRERRRSRIGNWEGKTQMNRERSKRRKRVGEGVMGHRRWEGRESQREE